jgi:hypothetical protein
VFFYGSLPEKQDGLFFPAAVIKKLHIGALRFWN